MSLFLQNETDSLDKNKFIISQGKGRGGDKWGVHCIEKEINKARSYSL